MKSLIQKLLKPFGYRFQSLYDSVIDEDRDFMRIYEKCKPFTLTTKERMYALYKATKYIIESNLPGDFVECGVWKGGSTMVIAETLRLMGVRDRKIWLYDTFTGMSTPTPADVHVENASIRALDHTYDPSIGSIEEVTENMNSTGYENFHCIQGKVEDTIPTVKPSAIALLRLDTDWYESTRHELVHLFPIVEKGGVLIIDDYGAWAGSKKAVDEYFLKRPILITRIDRDGRLAIKT